MNEEKYYRENLYAASAVLAAFDRIETTPIDVRGFCDAVPVAVRQRVQEAGQSNQNGSARRTDAEA